jgi:5-methylcytosine-specific restriction enzyme subunit McrC
MGEIISCLEHEALPVVQHRIAGQKALSHRHVELLAKLEKILPASTFSRGHNTIKWTQYCGVIQLDDLTLEILPKVYGRESDPGACRQALVKMLEKARLLQSRRIGQAVIHVQRHTLLDVFILQFCDELQQQLVQGKIREYVSREENLPVVRGRLLVSQQFKYNLAHKERLYCRYDELSEDILLNRIIRYTLKLLLPMSRSGIARKAVTEQLMAFDAVEDEVISLDAFNRLNQNRHTTRYENIVAQCRMFIAGLSPDVLAGKSQACSLLFDMNKLFESWVAAMLRKPAWEQGLKLREQGPRKYLAYREDLGRDVFQMKPDIALLNHANEVVFIADAKWKLLSAEEAKLGIAQADLYQLQAYASRYEVRKLALYYPAQKGFTENYRLKTQGVAACEIVIQPVDVLSATLSCR